MLCFILILNELSIQRQSPIFTATYKNASTFAALKIRLCEFRIIERKKKLKNKRPPSTKGPHHTRRAVFVRWLLVCLFVYTSDPSTEKEPSSSCEMELSSESAPTSS